MECLQAAVRWRLEHADRRSKRPETRLEQAYHAILNCSLAVLRSEGLRAANAPSRHRVALESLANTLGTAPSPVSYFQRPRGVRHRDIHEGPAHVSAHEAEEPIGEETRRFEQLRAWPEASKTSEPGGSGRAAPSMSDPSRQHREQAERRDPGHDKEHPTEADHGHRRAGDQRAEETAQPA